MLLGAKCSRGPPRLPRIDPRFVRSIDRGNLGGFRNLTATFLETGTEPWATNRSSPAGASHESGRRLSCYRFGTGMGATSFGVLSRSRSPAEICLPIPFSPVSREAVGKRFVRGGLETRSSRKRLSGGYAGRCRSYGGCRSSSSTDGRRCRTERAGKPATGTIGLILMAPEAVGEEAAAKTRANGVVWIAE